LTLRADNADQRLTDRGIEIGAVDVSRETLWKTKKAQLSGARDKMAHLSATPNMLEKYGIVVNMDGRRRAASDLLRYPDVTWDKLSDIWTEMKDIPPAIREQIEIDAAYAGYIERQDIDIRAFKKDEALILPSNLDYSTVGSLSTEIRLKLEQVRPATLGAAARIPGVTPAAMTALLRHVKRRELRSDAA
jgi:tRNA uridine 5-carboxymethylaminomethyl modification enzyme